MCVSLKKQVRRVNANPKYPIRICARLEIKLNAHKMHQMVRLEFD